MGNGEKYAGAVRIIRCRAIEYERLGKGENGFFIHYSSEILIDCVLKSAGSGKALAEESRCPGFMAYVLGMVSQYRYIHCVPQLPMVL